MRRLLLICAVSAAALWAQTGADLVSEGNEALENGQLEKAEQLYTRASRLSGDVALAGVNGLYSVFEQRGKPEEGMKIFREHYAQTGDLQYITMGATRLVESGRTEQAARELAPILERLKKGERLSPAITASMAFTLQRTGDLEGALNAARHAEESFRSIHSVQWVVMGDLVASLLEDSGRTLEALSEYEFILQEGPENPLILNNYAYYLAVHNKDLERAATLVRRSLVLQPGDGNALDTLGFILLKLGKVEESIDAMVKAWRRHPDIMVVRTHLAQSLAKRKSTSKTMQELLDVLRTEPDPENTAQIEQLLAALGE